MSCLPSPAAVSTVLVPLVLAGVLLSGCEDIHASRRAAAIDVCAATLPAGQSAVSRGARLLAVRRVSPSQADDLFGPRAAQLSPPEPSRSQLCVLAYHVPPPTSTMSGAATPTNGATTVELALVTTRHPQLLATLLLPTLPPLLR